MPDACRASLPWRAGKFHPLVEARIGLAIELTRNELTRKIDFRESLQRFVCLCGVCVGNTAVLQACSKTFAAWVRTNGPKLFCLTKNNSLRTNFCGLEKFFGRVPSPERLKGSDARRALESGFRGHIPTKAQKRALPRLERVASQAERMGDNRSPAGLNRVPLRAGRWIS